MVLTRQGPKNNFHVILGGSLYSILEEQAGTGTSRRHNQGSKIAKRLPSVKYSFTVVEN